ncbi:MAG: hypothetical protein PHD76_04170 [Methylacidiphilales bacterium]|nr:hypothetical protein [Candidatus Methylacidiphilales bacterium]
MRPGRLWWWIQRDCKRGGRAAWHDHVTSKKILLWKHPGYPLAEVPVCVLTGRETWLLTCWMLASWTHFTERSWKIVLHDDGTLTPEIISRLHAMFPHFSVVPLLESDAGMEPVLRTYPHCATYRKQHPLARKIFDVPFYCKEQRFILLDSDVLFFQKPVEILQWVDSGSEECRFNRDAQDALLVSPAEAEAKFSVKLWPQANSGICLLYRPALDCQ